MPIADAKDRFVVWRFILHFPDGSCATGNLCELADFKYGMGQKDNFVDVPTDCPQRDEMMGVDRDAQVFFSHGVLYQRLLSSSPL